MRHLGFFGCWNVCSFLFCLCVCLFVISCLYSAVSLARVREWRFVKIMCVYYYYYSAILPPETIILTLHLAARKYNSGILTRVTINQKCFRMEPWFRRSCTRNHDSDVHARGTLILTFFHVELSQRGVIGAEVMVSSSSARNPGRTVRGSHFSAWSSGWSNSLGDCKRFRYGHNYLIPSRLQRRCFFSVPLWLVALDLTSIHT